MASGGGGGNTNSDWKEAERVDPANKQVVFLGWPEGVEAHNRLEQLEAYFKNAFPTFRPLSFCNEYKGPFTNRTLGQAAYANFSTADEVRKFLTAFKESGSELTTKGKTLRVAQARTKYRKARNWALRKALNLVKAAAGTGCTTELDWKERQVTVNKVAAFVQKPGEKTGTFENNFAHLALP